MQRVLVVDKYKEKLMPCHPARARELLRKGRAVVLRMFPFTILIKDRVGGDMQDVELKLNPGSKVTGVALVGNFKRGKKIIFAANLKHRGLSIKDALENRRKLRNHRRNRHLRYRKARYKNRARAKGWLPPSLESRIYNVRSFTKKLYNFVPITSIQVESAKFDTQKMNNQLIQGVEYQYGTLFGYELRNYLLEKWGYKCAYCEARIDQARLEIEHIIPRSCGGSNRVSNLVIACRKCNKKKGTMPLEKFLNNKLKLDTIKKQMKAPMRDAAAINATRYKIVRMLKELGLEVKTWSGGLTKFNRMQQGYEKDHWIDAACVGETGKQVFIPTSLTPLIVTANGHGSRHMCLVDEFGFPRAKPKSKQVVNGFRTGDIVTAVVTKGKKIGTYFGRVAIRASGYFNITTLNETVQGIGYKYCHILHKSDGFNYF